MTIEERVQQAREAIRSKPPAMPFSARRKHDRLCGVRMDGAEARTQVREVPEVCSEAAMSDDLEQRVKDAIEAAVKRVMVLRCEHGGYHEVYGMFAGGDPRLFKPDKESNTPEELEAHRNACEEWERGEGTDRGPSCATMGDGSAYSGTGFGMGVMTFPCDDPVKQDAIRAELKAAEARGRIAAERVCKGCGIRESDPAFVQAAGSYTDGHVVGGAPPDVCGPMVPMNAEMSSGAQTDSVVNTIRGKNLVGAATKEDIDKLSAHIDALETLLDEADSDDMFGTEGWRHQLGID